MPIVYANALEPTVLQCVTPVTGRPSHHIVFLSCLFLGAWLAPPSKLNQVEADGLPKSTGDQDIWSDTVAFLSLCPFQYSASEPQSPLSLVVAARKHGYQYFLFQNDTPLLCGF